MDFANAFNTLSRDAILNYVATDLPEILNFVKLCYDQSSPVCFGDYLLLSGEGAQQGAPRNIAFLQRTLTTLGATS